jgi:exosome complex RNA-binding protein Csl4
VSYDTWKLQTPEEYFGAISKRCTKCDDFFETYREEDSICQLCEEEEDNEDGN